MKKLFFAIAASCALSYSISYADEGAPKKNAPEKASVSAQAVVYDTVRTFFDDGSVARMYTVLHGTEVRDGLALTYHPNGKVAIEAPYIAGKLDGVFKTYFESGKLWKTVGYKNGVEEGFTIVLHENGKRASREKYSAGVLDGLSEEWDEKGVTRRKIPYKSGRIHGRAQVYDDLGALKEEMDFVDGVRTGIYRRYEKGVMVLEAEFENNRCIKNCKF